MEENNKKSNRKWKIMTAVFASLMGLGMIGCVVGPVVILNKNKGGDTPSTKTEYSVNLISPESLKVEDIRSVKVGSNIVLNVISDEYSKPSIDSNVKVSGKEQNTFKDCEARIDFVSKQDSKISWKITIPAKVITGDVGISLASSSITKVDINYKSVSEQLKDVDSPFVMDGETYNVENIKRINFMYTDGEALPLDKEEYNRVQFTDPSGNELISGVGKFAVKNMRYAHVICVLDKSKQLTTNITVIKNYYDAKSLDKITTPGNEISFGVRYVTKEAINNLKTLNFQIKHSGSSGSVFPDTILYKLPNSNMWLNATTINTDLRSAGEGVPPNNYYLGNTNFTLSLPAGTELYINFLDGQSTPSEVEISFEQEIPATVYIHLGILTYNIPVIKGKEMVIPTTMGSGEQMLDVTKVHFYKDEDCKEEVQITGGQYSQYYLILPKNSFEGNKLHFKFESIKITDIPTTWRFADKKDGSRYGMVITNGKYQSTTVDTINIPDQIDGVDVELVYADDLYMTQFIKEVSLPSKVTSFRGIANSQLERLVLNNTTYDEDSSYYAGVKSAINNRKMTFYMKNDATYDVQWKTLFTNSNYEEATTQDRENYTKYTPKNV